MKAFKCKYIILSHLRQEITEEESNRHPKKVKFRKRDTWGNEGLKRPTYIPGNLEGHLYAQDWTYAHKSAEKILIFNLWLNFKVHRRRNKG